MVLTAYFVLSPVIGLVCHRRRGLRFCPRPVGRQTSARLDAGVEASGPHDFAVRFMRPAIAHGNPPCDHLVRAGAAASTASRPAFVTIAIRPSVGGDPNHIRLIWGSEKPKYFCKWGWTGQSTSRQLICPSGKSDGCNEAHGCAKRYSDGVSTARARHRSGNDLHDHANDPSRHDHRGPGDVRIVAEHDHGHGRKSRERREKGADRAQKFRGVDLPLPCRRLKADRLLDEKAEQGCRCRGKIRRRRRSS